MVEGGPENSVPLEHTPTWVVATVCFAIVFMSITIERAIHALGKYLKKKNQKSLFEALTKVKEELMLLGFISLLLAAFKGAISRICVPKSLTHRMLPCERETKMEVTIRFQSSFFPGILHGSRRLLEESQEEYCAKKGKVPMLSIEGLDQLHIFIFVLAVVHIAFSVSTVILGGAKIHKWKHWEDSIAEENSNMNKTFSLSDALSNSGFTHVHQHSFVRGRFQGMGKESTIRGWLILMDDNRILGDIPPKTIPGNQGFLCQVWQTQSNQFATLDKPYLVLVGSITSTLLLTSEHSFTKQFYASVSKSDYKTLRLGFIMMHCGGNSNFNFHNYMIRALEADFKKVVGIRWYLWIFAIIFLLLNVDGWHTYFWIAFIPLILLLALGTKLEHVITQLAHEVAEKHTAIEGGLVVQPSDEHFWFSRPKIVIHLIHFILFQNAFEIAYFFRILTTYGFHSCIMGKARFIFPRLAIGVIIQLLCSYSTLPLYAIVTQMRSSINTSIFNKNVQDCLLEWTQKAKKNRTPGSSWRLGSSRLGSAPLSPADVPDSSTNMEGSNGSP